MSARKPRYFLLTYYDDEAKTINVIGPITDDESITKKTVELRAKGRRVRVSTTEPQMDVKKVPSIRDYLKNAPAGYKHDPNLRW